jgi:hypothetical protein
MPSKAKKPTAGLSPFKRFVQGIMRVPKAAVDEAEEKRKKRTRKVVGTRADD